MQMAVLCDVAPCGLVETDQRFRDSYCFHHEGHNDGSSKHLRNIGNISIRPRGATSHKTAIFMFFAVRTINPTLDIGVLR
jgi:hypothetical protein